MKNLISLTLLGSIGLYLPLSAFGFGAIIQYEGEPDDRVVYFADLQYILDKTPPDQIMPAFDIRQISVTAVYENAKKPEYVHLKLQFQCPSTFSLLASGKSLPKDGESMVYMQVGDAVTFRIGPDSYKFRRTDLKTEPLPPSEWKKSSASMLSKAGTIACNYIEIDHALREGITKGKDTKTGFDFEGFGKRISKLGLPKDMPVIGETLPSEVLDFAWEQFWWDKVIDKKRPDPTGRWSTKLSEEDRQKALEKLKQKQQEFESGTADLRANLLQSIQKSESAIKADLQAAKNADKHPDGSKMNRWEVKLAKAFRGRTEKDVVDLMGNPSLNQAGGIRFLRYSQSWEQAGSTTYGANGVIGSDPGGYADCFAEFKLKQDDKGTWLVEDILVRAESAGRGDSRVSAVCDDVTRPRY